MKENTSPYQKKTRQDDEQVPRSRNDDPTVVYSYAWWLANGIYPTQILKKKENVK